MLCLDNICGNDVFSLTDLLSLSVISEIPQLPSPARQANDVLTRQERKGYPNVSQSISRDTSISRPKCLVEESITRIIQSTEAT
jgi:hypothetical protein